MMASPLAERIEPAKLATVGMLISFTGLILAALTLDAEMPLYFLVMELILIGAGFGIFITPNSTAIMGSVEPRRFGIASGMVGAMRTLGMAVSMTAVALVFSLFMGNAAIGQASLPRFLTALRVGLVVFSGFCSLGIVLSLGRGKRSA